MVAPLLPDRHPQKDFFICDFGDVIPKSDIAGMEHPLFTLSTKPDTRIRYYEHNGESVKITPTVLGMSTIKDKDILIYVISQLMTGINRGENPIRKVRWKARDLLVTTNRGTGGTEYKLLKQALERLSGTRIETNIKTNDQEITHGFGIIESYKIITEDKKKRMVEIEVTISEWLFNAVLGQEVLSINRSYFRLRKPVERRIYEIARKHCGSQKRWAIGLEKLHKKVGSSGALNRFKSETILPIIKHNHLPEYSLSIDGENVVFSYCGTDSFQGDRSPPTIKPSTYDDIRSRYGNDFDVYGLESEWLDYWESTGRPELANADAAFIGFCRKRMTS